MRWKNERLVLVLLAASLFFAGTLTCLHSVPDDGSPVLPRAPAPAVATSKTDARINCSSILSHITPGVRLGKGMSKVTIHITLAPETGLKFDGPLAMKRSTRDSGRDGLLRLLKEGVLLSNMAHRNVLPVLAMCYVSEDVTSERQPAQGGATLIVPHGSPVGTRYSWKTIRRLSVQLLELVAFLRHTEAGTVVLQDNKPEQFILLHDNRLVLSDIDDVVIHPEPNAQKKCSTNKDCALPTPMAQRMTRDEDNEAIFLGQEAITCEQGVCPRFYETVNLRAVAAMFFSRWWRRWDRLPRSLHEPLSELLSDCLTANIGVDEALLIMRSYALKG